VWLDVGFTGAASLQLIVAHLFGPGFFLPIGALQIGAAYYSEHNNVAFGPELVYIGTTIFAAIYYLFVAFASPRIWRSIGFVIANVAALLAIAALPVDRFLCDQFGNKFVSVHLLFLACDLAFFGLYIHSDFVAKMAAPKTAKKSKGKRD
jgi:hypothetical protein